MATLISVIALVQLIGATSAKAHSPSYVCEAVADIPRRSAAQASRLGADLAALPPRLVGLHVQRGDPQQRKGARFCGAAEEITEDMVAFGGLVGFDIAQH